ncbi:MAG: hypothetical protein J3K34DRAFT_398015 [Monoraphidium minutum]|nr:MAG: hypothetical protein J3K34DRAFT_398015 [Monoraphidium minutum]
MRRAAKASPPWNPIRQCTPCGRKRPSAAPQAPGQGPATNVGTFAAPHSLRPQRLAHAPSPAPGGGAAGSPRPPAAHRPHTCCMGRRHANKTRDPSARLPHLILRVCPAPTGLLPPRQPCKKKSLPKGTRPTGAAGARSHAAPSKRAGGARRAWCRRPPQRISTHARACPRAPACCYFVSALFR